MGFTEKIKLLLQGCRDFFRWEKILNVYRQTEILEQRCDNI